MNRPPRASGGGRGSQEAAGRNGGRQYVMRSRRRGERAGKSRTQSPDAGTSAHECEAQHSVTTTKGARGTTATRRMGHESGRTRARSICAVPARRLLIRGRPLPPYALPTRDWARGKDPIRRDAKARMTQEKAGVDEEGKEEGAERGRTSTR
ncbi:hypothetical protein C8R45DRAFT_1156819 [Mycena sanguinolenta]|nr:hypothetical protein C8R45DRAFT_1156819 [Mycena sanguinolenta]